MGVFYLAILAGTLPRRPQVSWLIPLVWFVLSLKSIRQGPLFAITAAVVIADMWRYTLWHRLIVKHGDGTLATDNPPPATQGRAWWVIPALLVLVSAFAYAALMLLARWMTRPQRPHESTSAFVLLLRAA